MSDRTPAEALARARWDRELDPDHPWYVAWDDVSPRLRQEQVEFAEADIELLAAAGFRVTPKPDDNTRDLADRLRLIANEMTYGRTASTHSDACWQWHESCALHRAADLLDGQPQDRPDTCPTCGWRGDRLNRLGNDLADAVPVRAPAVASQPYRNGYQDCIQRMRAAVEAWEGR